jgi:hypothetical protein
MYLSSVMNLVSLRTELRNLAADTDNPSALAKLHSLLLDQEALLGDPQCLRSIGQIKQQLRSSLFKANMHQLLTELIGGEARQTTKSLHDISGNFLWCQRSCPSLFNSTTDKLLKSNFFDLISKESLKMINLKYGTEVLTDRKPKVLSFTLRDTDTRLTVKCREVIYSCDGVSHFGILLESRKSRHPKVRSSPLTEEAFHSPKSPDYECALPLKRRSSQTKSSPQFISPTQKQEFTPNSLSFGDDNLEFSISPYLMAAPDSRYVPNVSEFKGL